MIFDTHSHCYWETLAPRIDDIVKNMSHAGVTKAVQIGCDIESSEKAIALARRFPGTFYATVGLHPETAQNELTNDRGQITVLGQSEQLIIENRDIIVAVGETGLDFHYLDGSEGGTRRVDLQNLREQARVQIENQKYWWREQWKLAQKYDLPLIIHTRDARDATLEFMQSEGVTRAVMHCFSEDWIFARELLDFSSEIYFSFSGIVTYKKSEAIQEAAKNIPLNRILIETDAPFLAPQRVRGEVNEPAYTRYNLEKIAEIRGVSVGEIEDVLYENSLRFYGLS